MHAQNPEISLRAEILTVIVHLQTNKETCFSAPSLKLYQENYREETSKPGSITEL